MSIHIDTTLISQSLLALPMIAIDTCGDSIGKNAIRTVRSRGEGGAAHLWWHVLFVRRKRDGMNFDSLCLDVETLQMGIEWNEIHEVGQLVHISNSNKKELTLAYPDPEQGFHVREFGLRVLV